MIEARTRPRSAPHARAIGWRALAIAAAMSCSGAGAARAEPAPARSGEPPVPAAPRQSATPPAQSTAAATETSRSAATNAAIASNAEPTAPKAVTAEAKACFQRAQAAYAVGDLALALKGFLCAFQSAPSPELHYNLARVYERMGETDESTRHYRAYLAQTSVTPREKKRIEARLQSLQALRERQRPPLTPAQPSADALSSEARVFYDRGVKLYRVKQFAAAQAAFNAALQMSNAPELHFNLAVVAERMNHPQEAIDHYRAYLAARNDAKDRDKIEERIGMLQTLPR